MNGKAHGKGVKYFITGNRFEGEYVDGKAIKGK